MRKLSKILLTIIAFFVILESPLVVRAETVNDSEQNYVIYDESGNYLFEKSEVYIGDYYISREYKKYKVIELNKDLMQGKAKFLYVVDKPKVDIDYNAKPIATGDKKICLYMTHNDESYVPTDGTESIYGAGGIHDVAKRLANSLRLEGIETYIDETLHIPHDSNAYSRSSSTAKSMLTKYSPNAIFDIHRDGTSRSYYINKQNGVEKSMVRIVIGKANSNMEINEQFAIYLMSVADEIEPGLIKDIYYAKGHYNQALSPKAVLFEMGCHLMEKELVYESADRLANVINTALFNTTVDEESGDLTVNSTPTTTSPLVDEVLDNQFEDKTNTYNNSAIINLLVWLVVSTGLIITVSLIVKSSRKKD